MSTVALDSRARAKRYRTKIGRAWINGLTDPRMGNTIAALPRARW